MTAGTCGGLRAGILSDGSVCIYGGCSDGSRLCSLKPICNCLMLSNVAVVICFQINWWDDYYKINNLSDADAAKEMTASASLLPTE